MFGAYQAGAWKALSRELAPDIVVGASVGALNGWYIAAGEPAEELERHWLDPVSGELMTYRLGGALWRGVFDPRPLEARARHLVANYTPRVEYGLALIELPGLRRKLVRNRDVTWRHLVASCAVPVGFAPVRLNGRLYFDGGLLEATPIWAAVEMGATRVIAVNASRFSAPAALSMLLRAGRVVGRRIGNSAAPEPGAEGAEIVIITPRDYLGTMLDGARWRRESIRRWIDLGESDALSVMESVRG